MLVDFLALSIMQDLTSLVIWIIFPRVTPIHFQEESFVNFHVIYFQRKNDEIFSPLDYMTDKCFYNLHAGL